MADSEVTIANRALQILGAKRISSLTQDAPNARSMNTAFIPIRRALQRKYRWNFCIKRASIAADTEQDLYEGLNRFRLPNDFVMLLRDAQTSYWQDFQRDWQIEGGFILTSDGAPLEFRYQADITDVSKFDPMFDELFAYELALATVQDVTGSNVKNSELRQDRDRALADARRANAFENDGDDLIVDTWIRTMESNGFQTNN